MVKITLQSCLGLVEVGICRDGTVDLDDSAEKSLLYDQTMEALGQPASKLSLFMIFRNEGGYPTLSESLYHHYLEPSEFMFKLSADYIEHIVWMLPGFVKDPGDAKEILDLIREGALQSSQPPFGAVDSAFGRSESFAKRSLTIRNSQQPATLIVDTICSLSHDLAIWSYYNKNPDALVSIFDIATTVLKIVAIKTLGRYECQYIGKDASASLANTECTKEGNWQVRRFVDCMEAVGRGLPWPPLEATE